MRLTTRIPAVLLIVLAAATNASGRDEAGFVRRNGRRLTVNGREIRLRGVCFGNRVWQDSPLPVDHHSDRDYGRVKSMGMNAVRFYMNYRTFEDDARPFHYKESGFAWIDKNVRWAKENGIYLILNIHVPQGGYQSLGKGSALWDDARNRDRLVALWKALGRRYRYETAVAAYDILNEPYPNRSVGQWKELAGRIVRAIREADPNHLLIVEKAMGVTGVPGSENSPDNFFLVPDDNTAYTFHFYDPMEFCFQGLAFFGVPNRARYPDRDRVVPPSDMSWAWATFGNPPLEPGNTDWKNYTGEFRPATNADWIFAFPVFQSARNSGTAFLRSYEVQEYDPATRSVRTVLKTDVAAGEGWLYWSENGSGRMEFGTLSGRIHVALSGTTGDASAVNTALGFPVRTGRHYRISGEMSGRLVPRDAACLLRVDFYRSPSGTGILNWDRAFLESRLERMVRFGETNNVPLYVGEFGANRLCFEKDRGGLAWVADALEFFEKAGLSYTYHAYHEGLFGIYTNDDGLPRDRDLNRPLADLISRKMRR